MIRVRPEDIYALRNSTGRPFTDHLDRLIRSSASVVGIVAASVSDNPRTNLADGGADTEVSARATLPDRWGYFGAESVWQYKAVEVGSLTDKLIAEEITAPSKQYVRDLLVRGYGYRFCICHDGTAERKAEIKVVLAAEIRRVNPNAPEPLVLFAKDVAEWTNAFPALAAELLHSELSGFSLFETWKTHERAKTPVFVPTPQSQTIRDSVRQHLDWTQKPKTTKLTISGNAGVGKTRTVLEALTEGNDATGLVFYSDDEDRAIELAQNLKNNPEVFAVIVADECMETAAFRIGRALEGFEQRIRLITITNEDAIEGANELRLDPLPNKTLEEILEANFSSIDSLRRLKYVELADGFLRFAILLCQHDAEIVEKGFIGEPLRHVRSYLDAFFSGKDELSDADRAALDLISLLDRCGVAGNLEGELKSLCHLVGLDFADTRTRLAKVQKITGLIGRTSRYMYVSPTPIAMVCFQTAWTRWVEWDTARFLSNFPRELMERFLPRASRASKEVGKVVTDYFRDWIASRGGKIFSTDAETEQLLLLVRADPDRMLPRLRDLVLRAAPEQLAPGYRSGRRRLIVELPQIAQYPEWFVLAESMLFHLALHEAEPSLGNNATKLWTELYGILDSDMATPFPERLTILQGRIGDTNVAVRRLCALALGEASDDRSVRMIRTSTFGRRVPPDRWIPKTWDEYFEYLKSCLRALHTLCSDMDEAVRKEAASRYIQSIRHALFRNILKPTKEGAGVVPDSVRPMLRAELRELLLLNTHTDEGEEQPVPDDEKTAFIREWIEELGSRSLHDELVEDVGPASWSHHLEQSAWDERVRALAKRLLEEEGALNSALPWLNSDEAGSAVDLGVAVGRLDSQGSRMQEVVEACRASRRAEFLRGYLVGLAESFSAAANPVEIRAQANLLLNDLWEQDAPLAYAAMLASGTFLRAFGRTIEAVSSGSLPPRYLDNFKAWNGQRHTNSAETKIACETLLVLAKNGDAEAANIGLEFLQFLFMRNQDEEKLEVLASLFGDDLADVVFGLLENSVPSRGRISHAFARIFATVMELDPQRAVRLVMRLLRDKEYETAELGSGLIASVAKADPAYLMEQIGSAMLSKDRDLNFIIRKLPIAILPDEIVIDWLKEHGVDGARILARHVPKPFVDNGAPKLSPITEFLLTQYGEDDAVYASFVAGLHSGGVFAGPISDWMMRGVALAEHFVTSPIPAVRKWALGEVEYGTRQAEEFRQQEEEDGFRV
jgi:hypothetical protein